MHNNIPMELRELPQWVCAGADKVPISPRTGEPASVVDPATWGTFEEALRTGSKHIGFVLAEWDPYTIIDLDNKPTRPCTKEQWERHQKILEAFDSYTERSTSGTGYHIVIKGKMPAGVHRDNVEIYSQSRYMICTGDIVNNSPIKDYQELLDIIYAEMKPAAEVELVDGTSVLDDAALVEMASRAANGDKFDELCCGDWAGMGYSSQSEADFALLSIIAYYTSDNEQVRRIFRMSKLGKREKAVRNDKYLNFALRKIRAQQPPPVDFDSLKAPWSAPTSPDFGETSAQSNGRPIVEWSNPNRPSDMPTAGSLSSDYPTTGCLSDVGVSSQSRPGDMPAVGATPRQPKVDFTAEQISSATIPQPPGLVGEIAQYIYQSAVRPVPEVALAAAISMTAGICGRSYNISGCGLNQYIVLLAKTGVGKEGAASGIDNLLAAVRPRVASIDQFVGPGNFASGQALIRTLDKSPCFMSLLGEFGLTLQQICDPRAGPHLVALKKVMLDLWAKSGWGKVLRPSAYSDNEKNTKAVMAPCVTIMGEATPETFYDGLDVSHILEGLVPRFSIIEYTGNRPPRNRNSNIPPPQHLVDRLADLAAVSLTTSNNNTCANVQITSEALSLLDAFDRKADGIINNRESPVEEELWNRAHLKALKLAGLLAVGINPHQPVVTDELAEWAINFVERDVAVITTRFRTGEVGTGDHRHEQAIRKAVETYLNLSAAQRQQYKVPKAIMDQQVIPFHYLRRKLRLLAVFKNDRRGVARALEESLKDMVRAEILHQVPQLQAVEKFGIHSELYVVGNTW